MLKDRVLILLNKFAVAAYLFVLILCCAVTCLRAEEEAGKNAVALENTAHSDKRISLFKGNISFMPPAGFAALKPTRLKRKLPENNTPQYIFGNINQSGLVFVFYDDAFDLKPEQLKEVKTFVEGTHRNFSGWKTSEIVEINRRKWFHFEWEDPVKSELELLAAPTPLDGKPAKAPDTTQYHYHEYTTSFNNRLLRFVFEAKVRQYPQLRDALIKSFQTVQFKN